MKHLLTLAVLAMLAVTVQAGDTNCTRGTWNARTNSSVFSTPTNWCDRIPASEQEQAVRDLAKGGVICRVLGHSFAEGRSGESFAIRFADENYHNYRTCRICGKCESKTEGNWK